MPIIVVDSNSPHLATVKKLGKENASTLGFFPDGAFDDHSRKKQILAALDEKDNLQGYLLYRISNRKATIVHLCIDKNARQNGTAKQLVNYLKSVTTDLLGISLKCRRDYEANKIWSKFGFLPISELSGRGKSPKTLVYWWFSHGHPTLFDISIEERNKSKIDVVTDANVFFDFDNLERDGYFESNALQADWLDDLVNICLVNEIYQEINRCEDEEIRKSSRQKVTQFTTLPHDESKIEIVSAKIKTFFPKDEKLFSERDKSDIRQVSSAICADAQYFVTRDQLLLNISEQVAEQFGLKILRPSDLIRQLDEIQRENEYQPARLSGTAIKISQIKSGKDEILTKVFQQLESKSDFQNRIRSFLSDIETYECWVVLDENDSYLAIVVYKKNLNNRLEIPIIRIQKNSLSATLIRHLLLKAIQDSINFGNTAIEITDSFVSKETKSALTEERFIETEFGWTKFHLSGLLTKDEVTKILSQLETKTEQERNFLINLSELLDKPFFELTPQIFVDCEKSLYPLKITDSLLPCFIIPIKPYWAKELFDESLAKQGLFPAKRDLALKQEQVYYRGKGFSSGLKSPARILWYVSDSETFSDVKSIRACSLVDEVIVDKPKNLFRLFKRLGIYEWKHVFETAKSNIENDIMAIRFSHTQLFNQPVSLEKLKEIFENQKCSLVLQSPLSIPKEIFTEIYKEGIINQNND